MCPEPSQSDDGKLRVRLRSATDDPVKIGRALADTALHMGAAGEVIKALQVKAPGGELIVPERPMRELLGSMKRGYGSMQGILYGNVNRWLAAHHGTLAKATGDLPPHLTPKEIEELHKIVQAHYDAGLLDEVLDLFEKYGLKPADWGFMFSGLNVAYQIGKLPFEQIEASTLPEIRRDLARLKVSRVDELLIDAAKRNTRSHLRRIGGAVADDVRGYVTAHEARQVADVIESYHDGKLSVSRYSSQGLYSLSDEERQALDSGQWAKSEKQLRSELYSYFKSDPKNRGRDWWRVAVSETRAATNLARLVDARDRGYDQIYYLLQPDACSQCKLAYLEETGQPRIFVVRKLARFAIETNGLNTNPAHKDQPNALLHPHCNCIPVPYIKGLSEALWEKAA